MKVTLKTNKTNYKAVRYRYIERTVLATFESLCDNDPSLPVDVKTMVGHIDNCRLWTYQRYAISNNITVDDVMGFTESEDACTIHKKDMNAYLLLYNSQRTYGRSIWSIAHELGHIMLGHLQEKDIQIAAYNGMNTILNETYEKEADYFAATLLCPLSVIDKLEPVSGFLIAQVCNLSNEASMNRYYSYLTWKKNNIKASFHYDIIKLFSKYIEEYIPIAKRYRLPNSHSMQS